MEHPFAALGSEVPARYDRAVETSQDRAGTEHSAEVGRQLPQLTHPKAGAKESNAGLQLDLHRPSLPSDSSTGARILLPRPTPRSAARDVYLRLGPAWYEQLLGAPLGLLIFLLLLLWLS